MVRPRQTLPKRHRYPGDLQHPTRDDWDRYFNALDAGDMEDMRQDDLVREWRASAAYAEGKQLAERYKQRRR